MSNEAKIFRDQIREAINKNSRENISNTPDFILADIMIDALESYERTQQRVTNWKNPDTLFNIAKAAQSNLERDEPIETKRHVIASPIIFKGSLCVGELENIAEIINDELNQRFNFPFGITEQDYSNAYSEILKALCEWFRIAANP